MVACVTVINVCMHLAVKIFRDVVKKLIICVKEWNRYRAATFLLKTEGKCSNRKIISTLRCAVVFPMKRNVL